MEFEFPEKDEMNHQGGNFVDEPGTYHVHVVDVKDGQGPKGEPIEGFTVSCEVLAGTVEGCANKVTDLTFFAPRLDAKESQILLTKRRNAAFCLATNLVDPSSLGSRKEVDVSEANTQQFIVSLERQMDKNEETGKYDVPGKFLRVRFADIWHVDDPDAKDYPKNQDALKMIDQKHRHGEEWFGFKESKKQPQPAAVASSVDYSNL